MAKSIIALSMRAISLLLLLTGQLLAFGETNFRVRIESDGFLWVDETAFDELHKQNRGMVILYTDRYTCSECGEVRTFLARMVKDYGHKYPDDPNFIIVDCATFGDICKRKLIRRILPAIDFVIHKHIHHYKGDFSEESLRKAVHLHFDKDRLAPFKLSEYLKKLSHSKKTNSTIAIFNHPPSGSHGLHLLGLARLEHRDSFFYCHKEEESCQELFADHPRENVLLIQGDRREYSHLKKHSHFDDLYYLYRDFKSPFHIPFGEEFKQKVMVEKRPVIIYILPDESQKSMHLVEKFRKEILRHFTKFHHSIIHLNHIDQNLESLFVEFLEMVGLLKFAFPLMFIVEKDPKRNALRKFYITQDHFDHDTVHNSIEAWHYGHLNVWPKTENHHEAMHKSVRILSNHIFKTVVFAGSADKAVLLHKSLQKDQQSVVWFDYINSLAESKKFKGLEFMMMDLDKNDPHIEVGKVPCVQIYLKDQWERPVLFDAPISELKNLEKVLEKRHLWRRVEKPKKKEEEDEAEFEDL